MTRIFLTLLFVVGLLGSGVTAPEARASDEASMDRLRAGVRNVRNRFPFISCRDQASGTLLQQNEYVTYRTTLYAGTTYFFFGAGCHGVGDLDVRLYDRNWNLIDKDVKTDASPIVTVTPRSTGTYFVKMIMYRGRGHANFATCYIRE